MTLLYLIRQYSKRFFLFIAMSFVLVCAGSAHADVAPSTTGVLQPVPTTGADDGLLVQKPDVPNLGLHIQASGMYLRNPLGIQSGASIPDRFALSPSVAISVLKIAEIGAAVPISIYQSDSGFSVNRAALGDVYAYAKVRIPIPVVQIGLSLGVGLPTSSANSFLGSDQVSLYPKALIGFNFSRVSLSGFVGGSLSALSARNCLGGDGSCTELAKNFGNQITYGAHLSVDVLGTKEKKLAIIGEAIGSYSISGQSSNISSYPLIGAVGLKGRVKGVTFSASYIQGITTNRNEMGGLLQIGYLLEERQKDPK